jgi:hypothetical protein
MIEPHIFVPFAKMVDRLSARAIVQGLELEYRMLQNDLERNRYPLTEEARSVLCFCEFIHMAKVGGAMLFSGSLPADHIDFYRKTIMRLVLSHELPSETPKEFDRIFPKTNMPLAA